MNNMRIDGTTFALYSCTLINKKCERYPGSIDGRKKQGICHIAKHYPGTRVPGDLITGWTGLDGLGTRVPRYGKEIFQTTILFCFDILHMRFVGMAVPGYPGTPVTVRSSTFAVYPGTSGTRVGTCTRAPGSSWMPKMHIDEVHRPWCHWVPRYTCTR
jgi:hypothetical protein